MSLLALQWLWVLPNLTYLSHEPRPSTRLLEAIMVTPNGAFCNGLLHGTSGCDGTMLVKEENSGSAVKVAGSGGVRRQECGLERREKRADAL